MKKKKNGKKGEISFISENGNNKKREREKKKLTRTTLTL